LASCSAIAAKDERI
jgi:calpain-10